MTVATEKPKYETRQIDCGSCGWFRRYTTDPRVTFDHPLWGDRPSRDLAAIDGQHHQCDKHRMAMERARYGREWVRRVTRGSLGTDGGTKRVPAVPRAEG